MRRSVSGSRSAEGQALTQAEAQMLLKECEGNVDLRLMVLIGLLAGLRMGEMLALRFTDIDWDQNALHVRKNLSWKHGKHQQVAKDEPSYILYTPKTKNSVRRVDLSPRLKDALWARMMEMQMEGKTGLIFQAKDDMPLQPGYIRSRWFKPACDRVKDRADKAMNEETMKKFEKLTPHDLRHTFASWLITQKEDTVYVSQQMGHKNAVITLKVYAHAYKTYNPEAAALMDKNLFGEPVKD